MALYTGDKPAEKVLEAAQQWRERCFLATGSLFSSDSLWTKENLADLKTRLDTVIEGKQGFSDKFKEQLDSAPPSVKQLAAEVLWLYLLFPHKTFCGEDTKATAVKEVWDWSSIPMSDTTYLNPEYLVGIGSAGVAYMTQRPDQLKFLVEVLIAWKTPQETKDTPVWNEDTPWDFLKWVDGFPNANKRAMRNVLVYFLFPEKLERIASKDHKALIFEAFKDSAKRSARAMTLSDLDREIYAIREQLVAEYQTRNLDFYQAPLQEKWSGTSLAAARKNVTETIEKVLSPYGLELNKCGSKKANLATCKPVDPKTGFWENPADATNKPARWIVHLDATGDSLIAHVAQKDGTELPGSRKIGFANSAQGKSGAITIRVVPAIRTAEASFTFHETWEWLLVLGFYPALLSGSAAQLFDDFDPATGVLTYKKQRQRYIFAALVALNVEDAQLDVNVAGMDKRITYQEATEALRKMISVDLEPSVESEHSVND